MINDYTNEAKTDKGNVKEETFEWRRILKTNGANMALGFSFFIDPVLNDEFKNIFGEYVTASFFQGFKVMISKFTYLM